MSSSGYLCLASQLSCSSCSLRPEEFRSLYLLVIEFNCIIFYVVFTANEKSITYSVVSFLVVIFM